MKGASVLYRWNDEKSAEITIENAVRFDVGEDGHLRVWADGRLCAAYAPGVWRSVVAHE